MSHDTTETESNSNTADSTAASSSTSTGASSPETTTASDEAISRDALLAKQQALEAENNRLRSAYAAAQRSRYRRTAIALCLVGIISAGAGVLLPTSQSVLFAIGATGLFAGVMTYYLSPNQFVAATIGDRLVEANVVTLNGFIQTLGLSGTIVYVPTTDAVVRTDVIAFLPQSTEYSIPTELSPGVITDAEPAAQGIGTIPIGGLLLDEFTQALTTERATDPDRLGEQLAEAITDQFELATTVEIETAITGETKEDGVVPAGRLTAVCTEPVFATTTALDHPIGSFIASGVATALDRPVELRVDNENSDNNNNYQATVRWEGSS